MDNLEKEAYLRTLRNCLYSNQTEDEGWPGTSLVDSLTQEEINEKICSGNRGMAIINPYVTHEFQQDFHNEFLKPLLEKQEKRQ